MSNCLFDIFKEEALLIENTDEGSDLNFVGIGNVLCLHSNEKTSKRSINCFVRMPCDNGNDKRNGQHSLAKKSLAESYDLIKNKQKKSARKFDVVIAKGLSMQKETNKRIEKRLIGIDGAGKDNNCSGLCVCARAQIK